MRKTLKSSERHQIDHAHMNLNFQIRLFLFLFIPREVYRYFCGHSVISGSKNIFVAAEAGILSMQSSFTPLDPSAEADLRNQPNWVPKRGAGTRTRG